MKKITGDKLNISNKQKYHMLLFIFSLFPSTKSENRKFRIGHAWVVEALAPVGEGRMRRQGVGG
jgi:hypothetical protein